MKKILIISIIMACSSFVAPISAFGNENSNDKLIRREIWMKENNISYSNVENPIVLDFKKLKSLAQLDAILDDYLRKHFEEYTVRGIAYFYRSDVGEGQFKLAFTLVDHRDRKAFVHFDVTEAYKKLQKSGNKEEKEKLKNRLSKYKVHMETDNKNK